MTGSKDDAASPLPLRLPLLLHPLHPLLPHLHFFRSLS